MGDNSLGVGSNKHWGGCELKTNAVSASKAAEQDVNKEPQEECVHCALTHTLTVGLWNEASLARLTAAREK